jgi:hypothetical protein
MMMITHVSNMCSAPVDVHAALHRQVSIHQHVTEHVPRPHGPHHTQQHLQPAHQRRLRQHKPAAVAAAAASCLLGWRLRCEEGMVLTARANAGWHDVRNACTDAVVASCAAWEADGVCELAAGLTAGDRQQQQQQQ